MKRVVVVLLIASCLPVLRQSPVLGTEARARFASIQTNWVDHWITNTAEIHMQANRFVTEFHTNWVHRVETNFVDLFATNVLTKYHTNWITQFRTNLVGVFSTNIITKTITNTIVLHAVETNVVQGYQTNLKTLNLTNWTTVVAFKTNWVERPLTNLVEFAMTREAAPAGLAPVKVPLANEPLSLQAGHGGRSTTNNQIEVQLTVTWTHTPSAPVQVQQWRVEREDGSILCFGQDPEFRRALPQGTYKVTVKAQRDAKSPVLAALGTLTVTPREVLLEQRPARSNSSI
jgi:hypothetical protein